MNKSLIETPRKSHIDHGEIYFWTATINKWQRLLGRDEYKDVITGSLQYLTDKGKIDLFAFVIMPNHLHFIWRVNGPNGKESPQGSLLKFTAHTFQKMLRQEGGSKLNHYRVDANNKKFEFWKRDSLAVPLFSRNVMLQKLDYIHNNPIAKHWSLVKDPSDYKYSSAGFYKRNDKSFAFIKNLWDVF